MIAGIFSTVWDFMKYTNIYIHIIPLFLFDTFCGFMIRHDVVTSDLYLKLRSECLHIQIYNSLICSHMWNALAVFIHLFSECRQVLCTIRLSSKISKHATPTDMCDSRENVNRCSRQLSELELVPTIIIWQHWGPIELPQIVLESELWIYGRYNPRLKRVLTPNIFNLDAITGCYINQFRRYGRTLSGLVPVLVLHATWNV